MNKRFVRYLVVMFFAFMADSLLRYYLPVSLLKDSITIISYAGITMYSLLNNTIDEDHRYIFSLICGIYYCIIYGNSLYIYAVLFLLYAFIGKVYMKRAKFTYFEALTIVVLTIFIHETVLYCLMWITKTTSLMVTVFMIDRLLPTLLFNALLFNVVYFIHEKIKIEGDVDVYFH